MNKWETVRLGNILDICHGKNQREVEVPDGIYPILGTGGVIGRTNSFLCDKPSVLIGRKGTIDRPQYMDTPFWTIDTLFYTKISSRAYPQFIFYVFCSINWQQYNAATGVPSLAASTIESIKIALPPLAEQRKIAEILRTWDEAIETAEAELKVKQERKRVLMEKLLKPSAEEAVRGSKAKNDSENFLKSRVGEVAELKNGYAFKSQQYDVSGPYRVITISNVQEGRLDATSCKFIKHAPDDLKQHHRLDVGDMLISMTGNVGRVCRVNESGFLLNQRVGRIIPKHIDDGFFYYVLASESFRDRMVELAQGGAQPNLSVGDILDYVFVHPASLQAQQMIAEILQVADADIELINKRAEDLRTQKRGLMQKLLTGEVRVAA